MITNVDELPNKVQQYLEALKMKDDTIIGKIKPILYLQAYRNFSKMKR